MFNKMPRRIIINGIKTVLRAVMKIEPNIKFKKKKLAKIKLNGKYKILKCN